MQPRKPRGSQDGGKFAGVHHPEPDVVMSGEESRSPLSVVDSDVLDILHRLEGTEVGKHFYLAGGTALALQIGHRRSNDLDFFADGGHLDRPLMRRIVNQINSACDHVETVLSEPGQIDLAIGPRRRKVSFIAYPFPVPRPTLVMEGQRCAGVVEIAAMKAYAIGRRGAARDYVDIDAAISKGGASLDQIISAATSRFVLDGESVFSERMFLQQLVYTEDLEDKESLATIGVSFEEAERSLRLIVADYVRRSVR
jgi:hypothetical protein